MAKGKYIQVGVTAMRDPKTGDFLPAIPLYVKAEDVGEDAEKPMLEDFAKLMALRMKQYKKQKKCDSYSFFEIPML